MIACTRSEISSILQTAEMELLVFAEAWFKYPQISTLIDCSAFKKLRWLSNIFYAVIDKLNVIDLTYAVKQAQ